MLLKIDGLTKHFGGITALNHIDMYVNQGEMVGLIGPNGAGKTTVFNLITGFLRPNIGKIFFDGYAITGMKPHVIAKLGIGRTFQLNPFFGEFTVLQNILASFYLHPKSNLWDAFFNTHTYRRNEAYILEQATEILVQVGLYKVKDELAKNLPHGYQKMLGMARALATKPKLLLLDEPMGGMSSEEIDFALTAIQKTRQQGITILLIEHRLQIMDFCDRIIVLSFGTKIAEGTIHEIRKKEEVIKAYFGIDHAT